MQLRYSLLILAAALTLAWGQVQALTPASYVAVEIAVRSITLEQLRERASGHESGSDYQQRILTKYREYHTTPGQHVRYANDYQAEIDRWLAEHPRIRGTQYLMIQAKIRGTQNKIISKIIRVTK